MVLTIDIVDLPIENGDFPLFFVCLPTRELRRPGRCGDDQALGRNDLVETWGGASDGGCFPHVWRRKTMPHTRTHRHTHIHYIYIYYAKQHSLRSRFISKMCGER